MANDNDDALKKMEDVKFTLAKAINAAETASKGQAIAAHAQMRGGSAEVIVYCEVNGKCMQVPVDVQKGAAGKVVEATSAMLTSDHLTKPNEIVKTLADHKQSLLLALRAAEAQNDGRAVAIMPSYQGDKLQFGVHLKVGEKWQHVTVDGTTGQVLTKPDRKTAANRPAAAKQPANKQSTNKKS